MKRTTKIGCNKGKPRVWIEGAVLVAAGFVRGDKFTANIKEGGLMLKLDPGGNRTVSGKGEKPIVDIATADLLTVAPIGTILDIQTRDGFVFMKVAAVTQ